MNRVDRRPDKNAESLQPFLTYKYNFAKCVACKSNIGTFIL